VRTQLLLAAYIYYEIRIWSQASWIWSETKLAELDTVDQVFGCHLPNFNKYFAFVFLMRGWDTVLGKQPMKHPLHDLNGSEGA
jgi:hypothetical protein